MSTDLRIGEVARRTGFPAPTLRYYEELGLLLPADRTAAGYRAYDESVLRRLAFIGRAKALGWSLEEIAELMPYWDGGQCAPIQARLRHMAGRKLDEAQARIEELEAFSADLQRILGTLGTHTPGGACDDICGCVRSPATTAGEDPVIACTLDPKLLPDRVRQWKGLLTHVTRRSSIESGLRLEFDDATPIAELTGLLEAERACCSFFSFNLTFEERGVALEVRAPAASRGLVDALFGVA